MAYFTAGIYDQALIELNSAIAINNTYYEAFNNKGVVLKALGKYQDALEQKNRK